MEVYYNGEWGTVCDDGWDNTDAGVVCRQLGFGSSGAAFGFGQYSKHIFLDGVTCTGTEATLARCAHHGMNITKSCSSLTAAGATCYTLKGNYTTMHIYMRAMKKCSHVWLKESLVSYLIFQYFTEIKIRLVGGSSYNEGRVEVYYNDEWGTVCDDGWSSTDARVVCRQLGFGLSGTAIGSAGFGQGSGSIWLDSVLCTGNESKLSECGHLGIGLTRNCSHFNDASVACTRDFSKHYIQ